MTIYINVVHFMIREFNIERLKVGEEVIECFFVAWLDFSANTVAEFIAAVTGNV